MTNVQKLKKLIQNKENSLDELLTMNDANARQLNYPCDLRRLTQLFGRPLQMKYQSVQ